MWRPGSPERELGYGSENSRPRDLAGCQEGRHNRLLNCRQGRQGPFRKLKDDTGHEHGSDGKFTSGGGGGSGPVGRQEKKLKELPMGKLRSMQTALQKPAWPEDEKKNKAALRLVEGAISSKV